jgi:hypothetical protein
MTDPEPRTPGPRALLPRLHPVHPTPLDLTPHRRDAALDCTQQLRTAWVQLLRVQQLIHDHELLEGATERSEAITRMTSAMQSLQDVGNALTEWSGRDR